MSAVDAPPGISFAGRAVGEFAAKKRPRRLAGRVFWMVLVTSVATGILAVRRVYGPHADVLMVVPLVCISVAGVGLAVRRARLRIDAGGIRWGWNDIGFRVGKDKMQGIDIYRDAIAVRQTRGSTWYLSGHDWDGFERMVPVLAHSGLPTKQHDTRAPLAARLQSYGIVLDLMLVADVVGSVFALGVAMGL